MAGQDGKDRWNVETDETKFLRQFRPQWWVWVHTQSICRHTPWLLLAVCQCAHHWCVLQQDLSLIKTDGAHNACVPVLPSGFEKENILMFARRSNTNGGDIVTGDWSDNAKWNSAVGRIRCKVAQNVQCGNVHAAAIHHNVPSAVVEGDSGGGNLPPPNLQPVSSLICGATSLNAKATRCQ